MRPVQYFSDEQLARGRAMRPEQVVQFLDDFRQLHGGRLVAPGSSTPISLRVPDALLRLFRARAAAAGVPYQTQIKRLMEEWVG
jgi:predicted DNA binding CopG/RHH family protein